MTSAYDLLRVVPRMGHVVAGRLDRLGHEGGGRWGIDGVAWPALPVHGQGIYCSRVAVLRLPADTVAALLPAGLSLLPHADGTHPVVLFFGRQNDVRPNIWPLPGWNYHEAVVAVPDVQAADPRQVYQGPFAFLPRLWLDRIAPVLAGLLFYGYAKRLERISEDGEFYSIRDAAGAMLAEARFTAGGPAGRAKDFPAWATIETLLNQPILAEPTPGVEIGSVLSFRTHKIRRLVPLAARIVLAPDAVPGFAGGTFTARGLDTLPAAFEMVSHWRITPPLPRSWLTPAPAVPSGPPGIPWAKPAKRRKIAVLGGGVGAMTAAWELTQAPDWAERYEITVYQTGWRLGGKCASGRNAAHGHRIEEHGLHIWAGFYENAFRMMRAVYAELGRPPGTPLATIDDAFKPHRLVTLEDNESGVWQSWTMMTPPPLIPGQPGMGDPLLPARPLHYLPMLFDALHTLLPHAHADVRTALQSHPARGHAWVRASLAAARSAGHGADTPPDTPPDTPLGSVLSDLHAIAGHAAGSEGAHRPAQLLAALHLVRAAQATPLLTRPLASPEGLLRNILHMIDLGLATAAGMIADQLVFRGFAAADNEEWCDWLRRHGAHPQSINSAFVRATYDYVFGFAGGDTTRRALAAGTTTHGVLRLMLTYRGAFFYAMQAGMGDTVFTPLYQVLRARGVRFAFFHRVTSLALGADRREIARIDIARQARPASGEEYDPLVEVAGLDCWPSLPCFDRLQDGDALRASGADLEHTDGPLAEAVSLRQGDDFDAVVLGISLGALAPITAELANASPAWRAMLDKVATVATLGVQLWFEPDLAGLGWTAGQTIATAYSEPLDTWADMSWLLPRENWPPGTQPGSVIYLCGTLADAGSGDTQAEAAIARAIAQTWLASNAGHLWPAVSRPDGALDFANLFRPGGGTPEERFAAQYFRANTRGSERYVQTVPGSTAARLRADESGFDNLVLAGDWVRTGMNAGCVEAAAMGGLAAAGALASRRVAIDDDAETPLADSLLEHALDTVHGTAMTEALVVVASLPAAEAQALLPDGLELAAQALSDAGTAPVLLMLAHHRQARLNILPLGLRFRELLVLVPATRPTGRERPALPGPYAYVARRYLDSAAMLALGRGLYGDAGQLGRFTAGPGNTAQVRTLGGAALLSVTATATGGRLRADRDRHAGEIDWLLARPLLARTPRGFWRVSRFHYGLEHAIVQGMDVSLAAFAALGLSHGGAERRLVSGEPGVIGAFRLWAETTRSNPLLGLRRCPA